MESRFSLKDFVIVGMLGVTIVMLGLAMVQFDRQWERVQAIDTQLQDQDETLRGMEQRLTQGVVAVAPGSFDGTQGGAGVAGSDAASTDPTDPFYRIRGLAGEPDFATGDWFIDAFGTTVKKLTPLVSGDIYAARIQDFVLESLLKMDLDTFEWRPWIAEGWEVSEDGLTYSFDLRRGVVFADGEPLTADDLVFTYEWFMNPNVDAPRSRAYYEKIQSVVAEGDYRVVFTFSEPYFLAFSQSAGMPILARHYYEQFTEDQFNELPGLLFGSGPYRLREDPQEWESGSGKIELVRNESYWGVRPALDRVLWREISEDTARLAEFRNRGIDRFTVPATMYRQLTRDEDLRERAELYEFEYVSSGYSYVGWNQRRDGRATPFADVRVRQAMSHLIDRQTIAERIYDNLVTPTSGPFHPLGDQADPLIEPDAYDPARADELLTEAGYIDRDGDGVREGPEGRPFEFEFIYSASSPETKSLALTLKDAFAAAGINMQLDPLDWPVMQQKLSERNFDAITLGWGGSIETDPYQMFHSDQIADGGDNGMSYNSPRADDLIERARVSIDFDERTALWHELHAVLAEEQPYAFMFNRKAVAFVDRRLQNVRVTGVGLNLADEYYVPAGRQLHTP